MLHKFLEIKEKRKYKYITNFPDFIYIVQYRKWWREYSWEYSCVYHPKHPKHRLQVFFKVYIKYGFIQGSCAESGLKLHGIKPVRLNGSFDSKCTRPVTSHLYQSFTILINTSTGIIIDSNNLRFK